MASVYEHHGKWWARLRDGAGKWVSRATPFAVTEERRKAQSFADETQRIIDESREAGETGPLTVARYAERWSAEREARGVAAAQTDLARMRKYALPVVGALQLTEVRPKHARDLVHALRAADQLAPRTIIHIYRDLRSMFESAIVDEIVVANPIKLKKGDLPKKRDKDPTWRSQATFTVHEVERLISDCAIPRRAARAVRAEGDRWHEARRGRGANLARDRRNGRAAREDQHHPGVRQQEATHQADQDGGHASRADASHAGAHHRSMEAVALGAYLRASVDAGRLCGAGPDDGAGQRDGCGACVRGRPDRAWAAYRGGRASQAGRARPA